ncbi:hypothetical protein NEIG_01506 [Nematocida sp. ERTm5]|nr:hypothetical protein NEIG_01506 [Nematocida sp. ERTm5]
MTSYIDKKKFKYKKMKKLAMKNEKTNDALTNLTNNIYCVQTYEWNTYIHETGSDWNESSIKEKSSKQTSMIIDIIKEVAEELDSENKKEAFYRLMENNHIIMANIFMIRKEFYTISIDILCNSISMPKLDAKITAKDAMIKLCKLTQSRKCSRLQRALDILVKHGSNLIIKNENGIDQSNASKLGITNDDIYSLRLLTEISKWNRQELSEFLIYSIYGSIFSCTKNNIPTNPCFPIYNLYVTVFDMAIYINKNEINIEEYKKIAKEKIKEALDDLKAIKSLSISNTVLDSKIYNDIEKTNNFNVQMFIANLIPYYVAPIHSFIATINQPNGLFNMQSIKNKFVNIVGSETTLILLGVCIVCVNLSSYLKLRQNIQ